MNYAAMNIEAIDRSRSPMPEAAASHWYLLILIINQQRNAA
jgi:hypothetical protein